MDPLPELGLAALGYNGPMPTHRVTEVASYAIEIPNWVIVAVVAGVISAVILLGWAFSPRSRPRD
jgi:hypothetical protein